MMLPANLEPPRARGNHREGLGQNGGVATLIIGPWILNATIHSWMIRSAAAPPTTVVGACFRRGGFWGWTSARGGLGSRCRTRWGLLRKGLETLQRTTKRRDFDHLQRVIQEYDVREIVVGLPLRMSGAEGTQSEKMMVFAEELRKRFRLPVHLWDERLTSAEANRLLRETDLSIEKRGKAVDRMAAILILQGWMESKRLPGFRLPASE